MAKSQQKGKAFERKIATALRQIYDPPELRMELERLAKARKVKERRELMKQSAVRRSDQGKGACEPDIVVRGCPCWVECQDAWDSRPHTKYTQAVRDVQQTGSPLWPTAVCHRSRESRITVWMALPHLAQLANLTPKRVNLRSKGFDLEFPVCLDFADWLLLLSDHLVRTKQ